VGPSGPGPPVRYDREVAQVDAWLRDRHVMARDPEGRCVPEAV